MERFEERTEILNDLLRINKDCSTVYERTLKDNWDSPVVCGLLKQLSGHCRDCILELHMRVDPTYGDPADAVTLKGRIYKSWVHSENTCLPGSHPK